MKFGGIVDGGNGSVKGFGDRNPKLLCVCLLKVADRESGNGENLKCFL